MPPHLIAIALILCLLGALSARADDHPMTLPSRDVDVTYRVIQPGATQKTLSQRIRWEASTQLLRVDTPSPGLYVVMDYRAHLLSAIRPAERLVLQIHSDGAAIMPGAGTTSFVRRGEDTITGLACTDWQTKDATGGITIVCLTGDGVMLRAIVGEVALVEAVQVTYGPIAADLFTVPADYKRVAAPGAQP